MRFGYRGNAPLIIPGLKRRPTSFRGRRLAVLFLAALVLRLAAIFYLQSYHQPYGYEHAAIAANLVGGRGFSIRFLGQFGPTSQQAPWYPLLLAGAYALGGVRSWQAHLGVQVLQAVVGAAACLLLVLLVESRLGNKWALGWLAGWLMALDPAQIVAAAHLQVLSWVVLALLAMLAWAAAAPLRPGRFPWLAATGLGLLCGAALLVEPILALVTPVAWGMFLGRLASASGFFSRRTLGAALLAPAVAWLVVAPWLWRNYQVHGQFVFVKSTFGYAFWQGNNPHSLGTDRLPKGPPVPRWPRAGHSWHRWWEQLNQARHEYLYIDDVLLKPRGFRRFASLSEPRRSALLGREAWRWIRSHPQEYLRLCFFRLAYFFYADWTHPKASTGPYQLRSLLLWAAVLWGAVRLGRKARPLWPLGAAAFLVVGFHALTIYAPRFGLAVQPLMLPLAAVAAADVLRRLKLPRVLGTVGPRNHASLPSPGRHGTPDVPAAGRPL